MLLLCVDNAASIYTYIKPFPGIKRCLIHPSECIPQDMGAAYNHIEIRICINFTSQHFNYILQCSIKCKKHHAYTYVVESYIAKYVTMMHTNDKNSLSKQNCITS